MTNKQGVPIEVVAERLLTPRETLDERLFDARGVMREDVRERLLKRANFFAKRTVADIPGVKVTDVCVTGSSASYFYRDNSDIDMKLLVNAEKSSVLTNDIAALREFFSGLSTVFYNTGYLMFLGERFVDPQISVSHIDKMGIYSVLNNNWVKKPDKNAVKDITLEHLLETYKKRYFEIMEFFEDFDGKKLSLTPEEYEKYYKYCYDQLYNRNHSVEDYLAYKLLNYKQVLRSLIGKTTVGIVNNLSD